MTSRKLKLCAEFMRGSFTKYIGAILAVAITAALSFITPKMLGGAIDAITASVKGDLDAPLNLPGPVAAWFEARGGVSFFSAHLWVIALVIFA